MNMRCGLLLSVVVLVNAAAQGQSDPDNPSRSATLTVQAVTGGSEAGHDAQAYALKCIEERNRAAVPELWALLDKAEKNKGPWGSTLPRRFLATAICRLGTEADCERILQLYDQEPEGYVKTHCFLEPLSQSRINRELDTLAKGPKAAMPPVRIQDLPLPGHLAGAPTELQSAWRRWKAITSEFAAKFQDRKGREWIEFQKHESLFYEAVGLFLHGRKEGSVENIARFEWGGGCGTGSGSLYEPKYLALFMALLKERQYSQAMGSLFALQQVHTMAFLDSLDEGDFAWKRRFFDYCGEDWEVLYAGGAIDGQYAAYLPALARQGGKRAASLVAQMAALGNMNSFDRSRYIFAAGAFVTPGPGAVRRYGDSRWIERKNTDQIPEDLQKTILDSLGAEIRPDAPGDVAGAATSMLRRLCRPETTQALRRALALPFPDAARAAAETLTALGEQTPQLPVLGPVRFRILVDGQPLSDTDLWFELGTGGMGSQKTDHDGVLALRRDYFVDRSRPVTNLLFRVRKIVFPQDLWFSVSTPPPADLDSIADVRVTTGQLKVSITPNHDLGFYKDKFLALRLSCAWPDARGKTQTWCRAIDDEMRVPMSATIAFPRLGAGRYQLTILAPGAARWESSPFVLADKPVEMEPLLQAGADLQYEVVAPGGKGAAKAAIQELRRDDKLIGLPYRDFTGGRFRGLPEGQYLLKIYSSDEEQERRVEAGSIAGRKETLPAYPAHGGFEKSIVIDEQSPALIDLGRIELQPPAPASQAAGSKSSTTP
jgi:hypothetical protein